MYRMANTIYQTLCTIYQTVHTNSPLVHTIYQTVYTTSPIVYTISPMVYTVVYTIYPVVTQFYPYAVDGDAHNPQATEDDEQEPAHEGHHRHDEHRERELQLHLVLGYDDAVRHYGPIRGKIFGFAVGQGDRVTVRWVSAARQKHRHVELSAYGATITTKKQDKKGLRSQGRKIRIDIYIYIYRKREEGERARVCMCANGSAAAMVSAALMHHLTHGPLH